MAKRPRKARAEGAEAAVAAAKVTSAAVRRPDPVPGPDDQALTRIVESFKQRFPEDWEAMALSPLQYGLAAMAAKLKGD